jgi:hypothetical protein
MPILPADVAQDLLSDISLLCSQVRGRIILETEAIWLILAALKVAGVSGSSSCPEGGSDPRSSSFAETTTINMSV